jgi:hypothetical protein
MTPGHLADDRLIELGLFATPTADERAHLDACARCDAHQQTVVQLLDDTALTATLEADREFPADRLARQRARILQRLEQDGRPGRVIAFPAASSHEPAAIMVAPARRSTRRVAASAAAAGLVIGLLAGHLTDLPGRAALPDRAGVLSTTGAGSTRPAVISDDEFLGQIELAVGSATPAVLNPLDALTPGAWDVGR